ncbi:DNA-processing protein DprA [Algoriphagus halophilus]
MEIRNQKESLLRKADELINLCKQKGYQIHTLLHSSFPQRLKLHEDCPALVFTRGTLDFNPERSVGIVGTRSATPYGKTATRKIIEDLAIYQPTIISGLAYGIDIEAHRAALQANLPTIAIMGSPINQIYPSVHKKQRKQC